jgi:beta-galactosidase
LWIWTAFAHGAEFVTTYRFRQPRFGTELFHHGLIRPDGVTQSEGGREFARCVEEMRRLAPQKGRGASGKGQEEEERGRHSTRASHSSLAPRPSTLAPRIGLLFDFEQLWYYQTLPQARKWDQAAWLKSWYGAIARLALPVKVLHADRDWPIDPQEMPMLVAPGVQMIDDALVAKLRAYVEAGGHLVLTCRTGLMDRTGQLFEGLAAAPLMELMCTHIEAYDGLPDDCYGHVELDGKRYRWTVWGDLLYAEPRTKVLAKYADQFYAGAAAVTQRKHDGGGIVTYCGVYSEPDFVAALFEKLAHQSKLDVTPLPPRVHLVRQGPYNVLLNYQDKPVDAPAPKGVKFIIGQRRVEPAGVAVWEAE